MARRTTAGHGREQTQDHNEAPSDLLTRSAAENVLKCPKVPLAALLANLQIEALSRPTATWAENRLVGRATSTWTRWARASSGLPSTLAPVPRSISASPWRKTISTLTNRSTRSGTFFAD